MPLIAPLFLWAALAAVTGIEGPVQAERLTILHTSEHHGQVLPIERMGHPREGGMAARASIIEAIRKERSAVLVVDSGDVLIGTPMSSVFRGEPDIKAMNIMGYAALAAGNHEFDFGLDHLRSMQATATFPILCTNLVGRTTDLPCRPSAIVRAGNLSVGLISVLGRRNFPDTFNREVVRLLALSDPVETAQKAARGLRETQGVDLVVAVTHQEDDEDLALLAEAPDVDVVIGGHTPGFDGLRTAAHVLPVPEAEEPGPLFVKTHRQGKTVGALMLMVARPVTTGERTRVMKAEAYNIAVGEQIPLDQAVEAVIQEYVKKMDRLGAMVVGHSLVNLDGESETVRLRESNLGNLLADLARAEFGTDIALVNGGQIRDSIAAGPVDLTLVLRVLPFSTSLVTLSITGQELRQVLENSVSRLPASSGRFLHVSGMTVSYREDAPAGSRVEAITVGKQPLDPARRYSVAVDSFLADGGDGYGMFGGGQNRIDRQVPMRDLLLKRLKTSPLHSVIEGRVRTTSGQSPPRDGAVSP